MRRSNFALVLVLIAAVCALFAFTPAPTFAIDTGPTIAQALAPSAASEHPVSVMAMNILNKSTGLAIQAIGEQWQESTVTGELRPDPGNKT